MIVFIPHTVGVPHRSAEAPGSLGLPSPDLDSWPLSLRTSHRVQWRSCSSSALWGHKSNKLSVPWTTQLVQSTIRTSFPWVLTCRGLLGLQPCDKPSLALGRPGRAAKLTPCWCPHFLWRRELSRRSPTPPRGDWWKFHPSAVQPEEHDRRSAAGISTGLFLVLFYAATSWCLTF